MFDLEFHNNILSVLSEIKLTGSIIAVARFATTLFWDLSLWFQDRNSFLLYLLFLWYIMVILYNFYRRYLNFFN
jgi:hypothetical protein